MEFADHVVVMSDGEMSITCPSTNVTRGRSATPWRTNCVSLRKLRESRESRERRLCFRFDHKALFDALTTKKLSFNVETVEGSAPLLSTEDIGLACPSSKR
jgi:ABC-type glutathione transport system ATPase component